MQDAILELCVDVLLLHIAYVETACAGAGEGFVPQIAALLILFVVAVVAHCQNRQEEKDRRRAENDYKVNLKTEIMIEDLYDKVNAILAKQSALEKRLQNDGKNHTKQLENN